MEKFGAEIKFLQDLCCHCNGHTEQLYGLFTKYKDSEALKKAILSTIEAYTVLNTFSLELVRTLLASMVDATVATVPSTTTTKKKSN